MAHTQQTSSPFSFLYYLLLGILPLVYVGSLVDNTMLPRQFFVSLWLVAVGGIGLAYRTKLQLFLSGSGLALTSFLLINILAISVAINPVESWATVSRYMMGLAFLLCTSGLLHARLLAPSHLIRAAVIFGAVTGLIALFSIFKTMAGGDFWTNIYEIRGSFSHKNLLSSALMLSFPFAVMGAATFKKTPRILSLILVFLLVLEMFLLRTRGVWLAVLLSGGVALFTFFIMRKPRELQVKLPLRLIGLGSALALGMLLLLFSTTDLRNNLGDRSNLEKRLAFWGNSVEMFQESPLLGVGPGNWKINFPKYGLISREERNYRLDQSVYQGITHIQRPHNDYLWVLTEGGIFALLSFLAIFVIAFGRLARNLRGSPSREDLAIDIALLFGLLAYLVFSFTDFPLERSSHLVMVLSMLALVYRHQLLIPKKYSGERWLGLVLILGAVSALVSFQRIQGEKKSLEVLQANAARNPQRIIPAAEAAMSPFYNMDNYANPLPYYSSLGKLALGQNEGALKDALLAYDLHPYNIIVLNQLGNVYKMKGELAKALEYYQRATDISVTMEAAQLSKAEIYLKQRNAVEAMRALNMVSHRSANPRYQQLLSQALPALVATKSEHGKFVPLIQEIQQSGPRTPQDYVSAYLRIRSREI